MTEIKEMLSSLIADLAECAARKRKDGNQYFTEELVILRLKEILKKCEKEDNT